MTEKTTQNKIKKNIRRELRGVVVSVVENKTIHVLVRARRMHKKYKKQYWVSNKYAAHDEDNTAKLDDEVIIQECRPMSKTKRWKLISVVTKAVS